MNNNPHVETITRRWRKQEEAKKVGEEEKELQQKREKKSKRRERKGKGTIIIKEGIRVKRKRNKALEWQKKERGRGW